MLYQLIAYDRTSTLVYAAADLFVGRGGASTVHEVAVTGVPAILVPWTGAAEDHQTANVAWLADGAAPSCSPSVGSTTLGSHHRAPPRRTRRSGRRWAIRRRAMPGRCTAAVRWSI